MASSGSVVSDVGKKKTPARAFLRALFLDD